MAGYLQRLLDTAAPEGAPAATLSPVVKSTSPIFENDQVVGLDAIGPSTTNFAEPMPFIPAAATPAGQPLSPATVPDFPNALSSDVIDNARYALPLPVAEEVSAAPAAALPTARANETRLRDARQAAAPGDTAVKAYTPRLPHQVGQPQTNPSRQPASSTLLTLQASDPGSTGATDDLDMIPLPRSAQSNGNLQLLLPNPPASSAEPPAAEQFVRAEPRARRSNIAVTTTLSGVEPTRPYGGEIEPRPRRDIGRGLPLDLPADAPARINRPPRISIGRVTVEIVPDTNPAASPPRPLTAAAASQIGPLGQPRTARRLLALKRL